MFEGGIYNKDGTSQFYNLYAYMIQKQNILNKFKGVYDYNTAILKKKQLEKAYIKWLGNYPSFSYEVVVFNLDYDESYGTNFYRPSEGICGTKSNYELSVNEWKGKKTLQLKIKCKDDVNKNIKDVLRDCYDNMIIIDFGFDYVLVIEDIPMYSYFSIIDESKHNNNYPVKEYYYEDEYVNKYLNNYKKRNEFDYLFEIKASMINDESMTDNKVNKSKRLEDETGVDYSKAPAYLKYLKQKNPDLFTEKFENDLIIRREQAERVKKIQDKKKAKRDKLNEIKRLEIEEIKRLKQAEIEKINEVKRLEQEEIERLKQAEIKKINEVKRLEQEEIERLKQAEIKRTTDIINFLEKNEGMINNRIKELENQDEINKKLKNILTKK